ncbi:MAG: hypothetical protein AAF686_09040, partial [Pseudomonadota bacterium]
KVTIMSRPFVILIALLFSTTAAHAAQIRGDIDFRSVFDRNEAGIEAIYQRLFGDPARPTNLSFHWTFDTEAPPIEGPIRFTQFNITETLVLPYQSVTLKVGNRVIEGAPASEGRNNITINNGILDAFVGVRDGFTLLNSTDIDLGNDLTLDAFSFGVFNDDESVLPDLDHPDNAEFQSLLAGNNSFASVRIRDDLTDLTYQIRGSFPSVSVEITPVPLPAGLALLPSALALTLFAAHARRKRRLCCRIT